MGTRRLEEDVCSACPDHALLRHADDDDSPGRSHADAHAADAHADASDAGQRSSLCSLFVMAPAPPAPGTPGYVYKDFAHLGPVQAKPTSWNQQDEMLLHKLYAMYGTEPSKDGLPGFPYIGAPLIGAYEGDAPAAEEDPIDDDEVRGTQV